MDMKLLARNVRRLRTARSLSQNALAEASGLSLPAIKKLELAESVPRMKTLEAIANAFDAKLQELFLPVRELRSVRFRSSKRMQNRENILAAVSRWIENFNFLEDALDERVSFNLRHVRARCSRDNIVEAAALCRKKLGLKPGEPIHDVCGLLEEAGIKVYSIPLSSPGFFGLSVGEEDGGPAIAVNVWKRISVERQIFSAAHELGHLILHLSAFDVNQTEENKEEENEANLFAGHFLMPDAGFRKEWNEASGLHFVDRVFKIKRIFRVSYKTVLRRLIDNGAVDDSIWMKFNRSYQQKFGRKLPFKEEPLALESAEPFGLLRFDFFEDRLSRLARLAVEQDKISVSRGAEIIGTTVGEMREILRNGATPL